MRFHMKINVVTTFTHIIVSHLYPIAVTDHQYRKMPQSHYLSSLCYTVFPMIHPIPCVPIIIPLNPLLPPSPPDLPFDKC